MLTVPCKYNNFFYHTQALAAFLMTMLTVLKERLRHCKRRPLTQRKTAFDNAKDRLLHGGLRPFETVSTAARLVTI